MEVPMTGILPRNPAAGFPARRAALEPLTPSRAWRPRPRPDARAAR